MNNNGRKNTPNFTFYCFSVRKISDKNINSNYLLDSHFQIACMLRYTDFSPSQDSLYHNLSGRLLCYGAFTKGEKKKLKSLRNNPY